MGHFHYGKGSSKKWGYCAAPKQGGQAPCLSNFLGANILKTLALKRVLAEGRGKTLPFFISKNLTICRNCAIFQLVKFGSLNSEDLMYPMLGLMGFVFVSAITFIVASIVFFSKLNGLFKRFEAGLKDSERRQ